MMPYDANSEDIILISYPEGGFGHMLYHVLTEFADRTVKVSNQTFKFSTSGDSHTTTKYTNTYSNKIKDYVPLIDDVDYKNKKILVLCDNGTNDSNYQDACDIFPNASIVRVCTSPDTRHVLYRASIEKAGKIPIEFGEINQQGIADYELRERYKITYHGLDARWESDSFCQSFDSWTEIPDACNIYFSDIVTDTLGSLRKLITTLGMTVLPGLEEFIISWQKRNALYLAPHWQWLKIKNNLHTDLRIDDIKDLHSQGYIDYKIETSYNIEIPVWDYRDWYTNTKDIRNLIEHVQNKIT